MAPGESRSAGKDHERRHADSAFVIATRDRAEELLRTVRSLAAQTVLPAELCIVDSSEATPNRHLVEACCSEAGLRLEYHHPAPTGLTLQRNVGIDRTTGDPVFLIDDDVLLDPTCHEAILSEYSSCGPKVGGIRPQMDVKVPMLVTHLFARLFGIGGWWPTNSGRVRRSLFAEFASDSSTVKEVECFPGSFMSFRREVFAHERFDEALPGYAYKEDIDFSYRVSRRYVLLQIPDARYEHLMTKSRRLPVHEVQKMLVGNHFYLHRKLMPQTLTSRAALWWAMAGVWILGIGKSVKERELGWVSGPIAGLVAEAGRDRPGSSSQQPARLLQRLIGRIGPRR